jgi:nuclease S1
MHPLMRRLPCLVLLLLISSAAQAWSAKGHRAIAEMAELELSPATREAVRELLREEPSNTLAAIAAWADEVRDQEAWKFSTRWHFINFPRGDCSYQPGRDCRDGDCIVGAIEAQRRVLRDTSAPRAKRIEALKWLVHFIGDIHQPLHAGWAIDRGGNDTQIRFDRMGSNLHALWDGLLIDTLKLDASALSAQLRSQPLPAPGPVSLDQSRRWAEQSCALIEAEQIYPEKRFIDRAYVERMRPLTEARMRLAAARLAAVLEADLGR